jgi:signal transduction histidine kinase
MGPGISEMIAAIGVPLVPLSYLVSIRRRELAPLELRVNRAVTLYVFLVLLAVLVLPLTALAAFVRPGPGTVMLVGTLAAVVGAAMGWLGYPRLQAFFDHHVLGIPLAADDLVRSYVSRIAVAPSIPRMVALLKEEVLPSLLVRQFLFLRLDASQPRVLLAMGVSESMMPSAADIPAILAHETISGGTGPRPHLPGALGWIRIVLAVKLENELVGLWLLGRRDPDDHYLDRDLELIRSLADQTAIALSNIIQTERVRELYQANVTRTEEERLQLAHALHDRVLNQLAALLMRLEDPSITPAVLKPFEEFSSRVREIVADLRPPMLAYGLEPALAELVETMAERPPHKVSFSMDLPQSETRYPPEVELHLFRIAQESCENAFHHAHAKTVTISGRLDPDRAEIQIADDGTGFEMPGTEALGRLISQKHFGLAGLIERADLIGGTVQIRTAPGKGTRIEAIWAARSTGALPHTTL